MRRRWPAFVIVLLALGMVGVLICFLNPDGEAAEEETLISQVTVIETGRHLELEPYHDTSEDKWYLFLPAFADADTLSFSCPGRIQAEFQDGTLTLREGNLLEEYEIEILQSENIPVIYVQTASGSMEAVNADKDYEEDIFVQVIDADGKEQYSGTGAISGRGVSTWKASKKPYNLKFSEKTNLIGEERAKTWCLLANYYDSSQLRNALVYTAANEIGIPYTSEISYASLYVNGEYYGLYTVATKQKYKNAEGSEIRAVFEQSKSNKPYDYVTENNSYIRYRYGSETYVDSVVNEFENVLFGGKLTYEELGEYIDVDSFARKYLLEIFYSNCDNRLSQYYAIDDDGVISSICAWDFDRSVGISNFRYVDLSYNMLYMANRWYQELMKFDEFQEEVYALFQEYSSFFRKTEFEFLDECVEEIRSDWTMNAILWEGQFSKLTALKTETEDLSTLEGNRDYIVSFLEKRFDFLNDYWSDPGQYCAVNFSDGTVGEYTVYCRMDTMLTPDELPDGLLAFSKKGFLGWYTSDGLSLADVGPVTQEMTFYGTWEEEETEADLKEETEAETSSEKEEEESLSGQEEAPVISLLKRVYHFFGLEGFGKKRLLLCVVFGGFFLFLIGREIREWRRSGRK